MYKKNSNMEFIYNTDYRFSQSTLLCDIANKCSGQQKVSQEHSRSLFVKGPSSEIVSVDRWCQGKAVEERALRSEPLSRSRKGDEPLSFPGKYQYMNQVTRFFIRNRLSPFSLDVS